MYLLADFVYPLLLAVLSLGLGLLLERLAAVRLPAALVLPCGFALLICVSQLGTKASAAAKFTAPLLVVLALAGLVVGRPRVFALRRPGSDAPFAAGLLAATFAVFAAPVILSGHVAWTSYGVDTTPAIHWLGAEQLAAHGYAFADRAQSSATNITAGFFSASYPSGGNTALGTTARLVGVNLPWLYQPFLAFAGAMLALVLYALLREIPVPRALSVAIAFIAAQPALLYGFYLQGQIKEVIAAMCVPLLATLVVVYARTLRAGPRTVLPLAGAGAAGMGATGVGFAAWLGPAAVVALVLAGRAYWPTRSFRTLGLHAGIFVAAVLVLALPAVLGIRVYFESVSNLINHEVPLGSLARPLNPFQAAGVWWTPDYRGNPTSHPTANIALIGAIAAGVVLAAEWAWRRRVWPVLAFALVTVPGAAVLAKKGTPWIDAKAMILLAPLILTCGLLGGLVALAGTPARVAGRVFGAAIALGVLYSTALMYHGTQMSPTARYQELARIADRYAGQGQTLRPDFDDYAVYFARRMDPVAPGDPQAPVGIRLASGAPPSYGQSVRLDDIVPASVERFPLVLLQRSPFESRPPANYRLVYSGKYYEVWRRGQGRVLDHLGAGATWSAAGDVRCTAVRKLAAAARRGGARLAVAAAPRVTTVQVTDLPAPANWTVLPNDPQVFGTVGPGRLSTNAYVPEAGTYDVWLAGSFTRAVHVSVDRRPVGTLSDDIKYAGLAQQVGATQLTAGRNTIQIDRGGGSLAPGNGAGGAVGPVALTPAGGLRRPVRQLDPRDYRELCGKQVDWIEAVKGVPANGS